MFVSVALKKPGGTSYGFMDMGDKKWNHHPNINEWIRTVLSRTEYTNVLAYTDDEPDDEKGENVHSNGGHAKGVVAWNSKKIGWLIHSVPNFPVFPNISNNKKDKLFPVPPIDDGQLIYGQSFIYLEMDYTSESLTTIRSQLDVMKAHIYFKVFSDDIEGIEILEKKEKGKKEIKDEKKEEKKEICVVPFSSDIVHVSKSPKWGKDLFKDFMADYFKSIVVCETWMKPGMVSSPTVKNALMVKWNDDDHTEYVTSLDHSKYAVSMNCNYPWVFIGDINRMESQKRRGGGGLMIKNKEIWQAFHSILFSYTDVVNNPYCNYYAGNEGNGNEGNGKEGEDKDDKDKDKEKCDGCFSIFKCFR